MTIKRALSSVMAGALLAGTALVALAGPASASDAGPELPGDIFFFNTAGGFDANSAANQVTSGDGASRPFQSASIDAVCPAGTVNVQMYIRIPASGVPVEDWAMVSLTAQGALQDSEGRFYTGRGDLMAKSDAINYVSPLPGHTGTLPLIMVCQGAGGGEVYGYVETPLTMTATSSADLQWSIPAKSLPLAASTTTLAASAATVEQGTSVDLTATVTPAAATGDVQFFAGATSLGTATVASGTATLSTSALPVGTNSITAQYLGGSNAASTSAAVTVEVTPVAARTTTTTLVVSPDSGPAYASVTLTSTVVASAGAANGTLTFKDGATNLGSVPVTAGVVPTFTTNVLGAGAHSIVAEFVGTAPYGNSASAAVPATYTLVGAVDEQTVNVEIPAGTISITTPYTEANPLALGMATLDIADSTYSASAPFTDIVITDTRAGNLGFTASVVSGPFVGATGSFPGKHAGLTDLVPVQVAGNALQASNVVVSNHVPWVDGLDVPKVFATYAAGQSVGTAFMNGVFGVDQVPTSVAPGLYTATVTFTAV